jgi:drug efflux transport system permease protein
MRTIIYLLQKEFLQIFRNRIMLPIIFLVPVIQLIVLANAATLEMKDIDVIVVDQDLSTSSRKLINKFEGSPFFVIKDYEFTVDKATEQLIKNDDELILVIPKGFETNLVREGSTELQLIINSINSTVAGLTNFYSKSVIMDFNKNIITDFFGVSKGMAIQTFNISYSFWFNPELNYKTYMVPGILVILVTVIGMFLTALNLVREKEMGTIEQINVTPIKKYQFIIGKLIPFWIIALFDLALGLLIGKLLFDIPIVGSLFVLFGFASIYLLLALGIGLLISTISNSQQQVMFVSFFFLLTFVLMSGIFTPAESMSNWAQLINTINPLAYFMRVMRMILLKGSEFIHIIKELIYLLIYGITILSLAIWSYRKVA